MRFIGIVTGAIITLLVLVYIGVGFLRPAMNGPARADLQSQGKAHSFVEIAMGTVHYRAEGPRDAPTILLVHGFSTPSFVYDDYFAPLTAAGFRVIAFDILGRGYSDRPATRYTEALFVGQIRALADALDVRAPFHLVGYSMGGAVVSDYADRYPQDVASVSLLAPAGIAPVDGVPPYFLTPILGDWIFRVLGPHLLLSRLEDGMEEAPDPDAFLARFREPARYDGYFEALLSTMRHYPFAPRAEAHGRIGEQGIPVLSVWGRQDAVIPIKGAQVLADWHPNAAVKVIDEGTHSITYSHAEEIVSFLIENLP